MTGTPRTTRPSGSTRRTPSKSAVVATDKKGGLLVYDLGGSGLQYLKSGDMNNVNMRAGETFMLGGRARPNRPRV